MLGRLRKLYVALFGVGFALVAVLSAWPQLTTNARASAATLFEEGTLRLHKFEQPIGEEKYSVLREGDELQLAVSFHFNDRGQDVPLSAFVRMALDLAPRSMEIHGDMARGTPIDDAVLVEQDKILTRINAEWRISERPTQFFTIATYAPAALQMMLLRRWQTAGRAKEFQTFPAGELAIEDRGPDEFSVNGSKVNLERFSVADLTWGRETLWLDAQGRLAALVTVDGEYDHFEAVRPEYEEDLGSFVQRAATDEMAALAELSKNFRSDKTQGTLALVGGTLIDGTGAPPLKDSAVVIQNGKILSAGPRGKVALPKDAQVLDVTGKTVIPGLWDMHAHFELWSGGLSIWRRGSPQFEIAAMNSSSSPLFVRQLTPAAVLAHDCFWPASLTARAPLRWALRAWTLPNKHANGSIAITTLASIKSRSTAQSKRRTSKSSPRRLINSA